MGRRWSSYLLFILFYRKCELPIAVSEFRAVKELLGNL